MPLFLSTTLIPMRRQLHPTVDYILAITSVEQSLLRSEKAGVSRASTKPDKCFWSNPHFFFPTSPGRIEKVTHPESSQRAVLGALRPNMFATSPLLCSCHCPWPQALEVRVRLIPAAQKVLLCSAWVDSGEYLAAAAKLVAQCQAEVFGIACVRFEQNSR